MRLWAARGKKGYAALLGDADHRVARYRIEGGACVLERVQVVDTQTLCKLATRHPGVRVCICARSVYSDIGEFSRVSEAAAKAHIKTTVDKIGLFREEYRISAIKLEDTDDLKGKYSFLVLPLSNLSPLGMLDEDNAVVEACCPVEAALAETLRLFEKSMALLVAQDARHIRIIAAKDGVIYYLITVNAAESFDPVAETVSGIKEITSLLAGTHREKVAKIYLLGAGEVSPSDLERHGVEVAGVPAAFAPDTGIEYACLFGTAMGPRYDFTTDRLRTTRTLVRFSRISMVCSLLMIVMSAVWLGLASINHSSARFLEARAVQESRKVSTLVGRLEKSASTVNLNVDVSRINELMKTYRDFQSEPRFDSLVEAVCELMPEHVYLTRVALERGTQGQGGQSPRVIPEAVEGQRTALSKSFGLTVEGLVNVAYPDSKTVFSRIVSRMNSTYQVKNASFRHTDDTSWFKLECEVMP
ncbi:MAG TPA: hypothetical protein PLS81_00735 [Deltaproteobacteria bacterium]|nr:hypothetical protein [Deltaproteobacteria bacterium]HPP80881.1 hypothetical protein [Deltaproteobacteria bacterium]